MAEPRGGRLERMRGFVHPAIAVLIPFAFLCAVDGIPQVRVNGELFEAGFYTLDDLPGPIAPGQREIIERGLQDGKMAKRTDGGIGGL